MPLLLIAVLKRGENEGEVRQGTVEGRETKDKTNPVVTPSRHMGLN